MKTFIANNNLMVHSEKETYKNGYIKVWDGKTAEVGPGSQYKQDDDAKVITLSPDYQVIPGAIDIHKFTEQSNSDATDATHDANYPQWQRPFLKKEPPAFWPLQ